MVVVGLETDVCVAQTCLGLQQVGYRAVAVEDATSSPPPHHDHGIKRMRDAGVTILSTKGLFYEWVRDLETLAKIDEAIQPMPGAATKYSL